ncbi:MAG: preprotein translocase subunit SecE [Chloroflexota bacterium]|nr:preprotein translocase subunit SecE [Chloroflexota bacterium]MDQ5864433.1 preprotein translocase subunit SecE [Chloroflexota bacterium]
MALTGRRQPATTQTPERTRPRATATTGGSGNGTGTGTSTGRFGRLRGNIRDIMAELRKVTWPTREETRNLTIVVLGITAVIGSALAALDTLLQFLYRTVNP